MESAFLKLVAGTRLTNYMGLKMDTDVPYKFGKSYLYIEIPVAAVLGAESATVEDMLVKRNQHVFIKPACMVNVKGSNIIEVEPYPDLAQYGQVQAGYKIHPGTGEIIPGFWFSARKDIDISKLEYAIRIYMYA